MVENNFGMTLLPHLALKDLKNTDKVKYIRSFEKPIPHREVGLVFRRAQLKKRVREALCSEVRKIIPKKYHKKPTDFIVG
jgi:LysR family hydrogen peroxide-inducible transcriptional activator